MQLKLLAGGLAGLAWRPQFRMISNRLRIRNVQHAALRIDPRLYRRPAGVPWVKSGPVFRPRQTPLDRCGGGVQIAGLHQAHRLMHRLAQAVIHRTSFLSNDSISQRSLHRRARVQRAEDLHRLDRVPRKRRRNVGSDPD